MRVSAAASSLLAEWLLLDDAFSSESSGVAVDVAAVDCLNRRAVGLLRDCVLLPRHFVSACLDAVCQSGAAAPLLTAWGMRGCLPVIEWCRLLTPEECSQWGLALSVLHRKVCAAANCPAANVPPQSALDVSCLFDSLCAAFIAGTLDSETTLSDPCDRLLAHFVAAGPVTRRIDMHANSSVCEYTSELRRTALLRCAATELGRLECKTFALKQLHAMLKETPTESETLTGGVAHESQRGDEPIVAALAESARSLDATPSGSESRTAACNACVEQLQGVLGDQALAKHLLHALQLEIEARVASSQQEPGADPDCKRLFDRRPRLACAPLLGLLEAHVASDGAVRALLECRVRELLEAERTPIAELAAIFWLHEFLHGAETYTAWLQGVLEGSSNSADGHGESASKRRTLRVTLALSELVPWQSLPQLRLHRKALRRLSCLSIAAVADYLMLLVSRVSDLEGAFGTGGGGTDSVGLSSESRAKAMKVLEEIRRGFRRNQKLPPTARKVSTFDPTFWKGCCLPLLIELEGDAEWQPTVKELRQQGFLKGVGGKVLV